MKKYLSILLTGALVLSLLQSVPYFEKTADAGTATVISDELYGDRLDIDSYLDYLSKNTDFQRNAEAIIKAQVLSEEISESAEAASDDNFTYDGGTKYFLNRDLAFKPFTLRSVGETVEVWVANDLSFPAGDPRTIPSITQEQVDKLKLEFDSNIYPVATDFFGTPELLDGSHSPLADWGYVPEGYYEGNSKIIILVDNILDENYYDPSYPFFVAGFFWQTLENYIDRNIITIDTNSWETRLESTFYPTAIHELQHLIHSDHDPLEESWINEGMSTFSEYLGGYGLDASLINYYLDRPENSLVNWDEHYSAPTGPETIADYGQVYLFTMYMNDKLGKNFIKALALNPKQGIDSINEVLRAHGSRLDFTSLYQNFITALVLDSDKPGNGIYNFDSINLRDIPIDNSGTPRGRTVDFESAVTYEKEGVPAWGGDFKKLAFDRKIDSISFDGVDFLPVPWLPVSDPLSSDGNMVLWSNEGNEVDNSIIVEADLTNVTSATLNFDQYYQIEEGWDYGFVQVSTDGGYTWTSLENENTRSDVDPDGYPKIKDNLPGFTGTLEGWSNETFDISAFAGRKLLISFRYITDWATYEDGWFLDNITIPEIGLTFDGSSTVGLKSLSELMGQYVNYTVTFINEKVKGNGKKPSGKDFTVITVDPFNVTEENALNIKKLFKDGNNYMITTYAAPVGYRDPVFFSYEINIKKPDHKVKKVKPK